MTAKATQFSDARAQELRAYYKLPDLLTTAEAAFFLRRSVQFLEIARHRGVGPKCLRIGRRVYYTPENLRAWLSEMQQQHAAIV